MGRPIDAPHDEETFEQGFNEGYASGYDEGYRIGYAEARTMRFVEQYEDGYRDGRDDIRLQRDTANGAAECRCGLRVDDPSEEHRQHAAVHLRAALERGADTDIVWNHRETPEGDNDPYPPVAVSSDSGPHERQHEAFPRADSRRDLDGKPGDRRGHRPNDALRASDGFDASDAQLLGGERVDHLRLWVPPTLRPRE